MIAARTHQRTRHLLKHYNLSFLKEYYGSDNAAMLQILKLYLEHTPKDMESIQLTLQENNTPLAKEATHKIKANVAMLGIADPVGFCPAMHQLSPENDIDEEIMLKFKVFKSEILVALNEISSDYFS